MQLGGGLQCAASLRPTAAAAAGRLSLCTKPASRLLRCNLLGPGYYTGLRLTVQHGAMRMTPWQPPSSALARLAPPAGRLRRRCSGRRSSEGLTTCPRPVPPVEESSRLCTG